jgi:hypothetical protein
VVAAAPRPAPAIKRKPVALKPVAAVPVATPAASAAAPVIKLDLNAPPKPPTFNIAPPTPEVPVVQQPGAGAAANMPALTGKEELTGEKFKQANEIVTKWRAAQAQMVREAARAGKKTDPEDIKRKAAMQVYGTYGTTFGGMRPDTSVTGLAKTAYELLPSVDLNLKGAVGNVLAGMTGVPGAQAIAEQALGPAYKVEMSEQARKLAEKAAGRVDPETALRDVEEKEAYVNSINKVNEDPLVRKARADAERFASTKNRPTPPQLVGDFLHRETNLLMVQRDQDKLKNTDPLAYEAARKQAEADAREVAEKLRISGDPVFSAGVGVVTTDEVKRAIRSDGLMAGLMKAGSVLLPQQIVSKSGETVRTESIPATGMRWIGLGNAVLASSVKMPGRERIDPLAAAQRGESMVSLALDNDQIRKQMASDNSL